MPRRAIKRRKAAMNDEVIRFDTISRCTALTAKQINTVMYDLFNLADLCAVQHVMVRSHISSWVCNYTLNRVSEPPLYYEVIYLIAHYCCSIQIWCNPCVQMSFWHLELDVFDIRIIFLSLVKYGITLVNLSIHRPCMFYHSEYVYLHCLYFLDDAGQFTRLLHTLGVLHPNICNLR